MGKTMKDFEIKYISQGIYIRESCLAYPSILSPIFIVSEFFQNSVNYRILIAMQMILAHRHVNCVQSGWFLIAL